jgi:sec-independent protein translocase protein TatC
MALVPFPGSAAPKSDAEQVDGPYAVNSASPVTSSRPAGQPSEDEEPPEGRMTFLEHLDELRRRITHAVVALLVGFLIASAFGTELERFVYGRLTADIPGGKFIFTDPGEAFFIWIKISAIAGLLLSSWYVMWQVWLFIAPGLYANEKKLAVPFVLFGTILFVSGAAFSHYILFPLAWRFFASFSNEFIEFTPRIEPVFSLYMRLLLAMGLVFQLPMLMFALARFGIVTTRFLLTKFKYAVLIMFIVAAIVTPDASFIPQIIMAGCMIALYGLSIGVVWMFGKKKPDEDMSR